MKYTYITFLLLLNINPTYSQVAKVKLEGGEDKASSEISDLEKRKTELTAAQRDFETGRDLLSEYYDLSFKAYETGDATYVDQAIAKLNDSKKMIELSQQKWNAYHKLNNTFKSPNQENDYNDFLRNVNELIDRSKLLKTSCCGPDIVKLHLAPQNVVKLSTTKENAENDFWVNGPVNNFELNGVALNLNDFEFKKYFVAGPLYIDSHFDFIAAPNVALIFSFHPKSWNDEKKLKYALYTFAIGYSNHFSDKFDTLSFEAIHSIIRTRYGIGLCYDEASADSPKCKYEYGEFDNYNQVIDRVGIVLSSFSTPVQFYFPKGIGRVWNKVSSSEYTSLRKSKEKQIYYWGEPRNSEIIDFYSDFLGFNSGSQEWSKLRDNSNLILNEIYNLMIDQNYFTKSDLEEFERNSDHRDVTLDNFIHSMTNRFYFDLLVCSKLQKIK